MVDHRRDEGAVGRNRTPAGVVIAELFLLIILAIYLVKSGVLLSDLLEGRVASWEAVLLILVEMSLSLLVVWGLFGLSSRRPSGWRQVARATVTLILVTALDNLIPSHLLVETVTLRFDAVLLMAVFVMVAISMPSVRRWYVPPMFELRPFVAWVAYAARGELYPKGSYRIAYPDERESPSAPVESEGILGRAKAFMKRFRSPGPGIDRILSAIRAHPVLRRIFGRYWTGCRGAADGASVAERIATAFRAAPEV